MLTPTNGLEDTRTQHRGTLTLFTVWTSVTRFSEQSTSLDQSEQTGRRRRGLKTEMLKQEIEYFIWPTLANRMLKNATLAQHYESVLCI